MCQHTADLRLVLVSCLSYNARRWFLPHPPTWRPNTHLHNMGSTPANVSDSARSLTFTPLSLRTMISALSCGTVPLTARTYARTVTYFGPAALSVVRYYTQGPSIATYDLPQPPPLQLTCVCVFLSLSAVCSLVCVLFMYVWWACVTWVFLCGSSFFGGIDCSNFKGWSTRLGKPSRFI